jgi:hypothetical protein
LARSFLIVMNATDGLTLHSKMRRLQIKDFFFRRLHSHLSATVGSTVVARRAGR